MRSNPAIALARDARVREPADLEILKKVEIVVVVRVRAAVRIRKDTVLAVPSVALYPDVIEVQRAVRGDAGYVARGPTESHMGPGGPRSKNRWRTRRAA